MTDSSSRSIRLNEHQRRHFEVLFARLEESLDRVATMLTADVPTQQRLSVVEDDVPDGFPEHATPVLARLQARIAELANELQLRPRTLSRRRAIGATLSAEAIRLEDSLSAQLRGYGKVDEAVVVRLDPVLQEMASMLSALAAALNRPTRTSRRA